MDRGVRLVVPPWWLPTQAGVSLLWIAIAMTTGAVMPVVLGLAAWNLAWFSALVGRPTRLTRADFVTLFRLMAGSMALVLWAVYRTNGWYLVIVLSVGEAADFLDGYLARQRGETTFGAFIDAEVDAAFMLALTVLVWAGGRIGFWVLSIGALRYVFALGYIAFRLRPPVVKRFKWLAKTACAIAAALLVLACGPISSLVVPASTIALSVLLLSFGREAYLVLKSIGAQGVHKT